MDYVTVAIAALLVSVFSLYSGFGLGTLLMPVFALFFPIQIAVASTAVVHLANNIFKVIFVGKGADWKIVLTFGLPATVLAIPGAFLLIQMSDITPLATYHISTREFSITTIKLVVAGLILSFAAFEVIPLFRKVEFPQRLVPFGGALSGFFGGLSGHQGALRSAVLAKTGLETTAFVGTVSVCALMVDISRLAVYGSTFFAKDFSTVSEGNSAILVGIATLFAFIGTYTSSKLLKQVTMKALRKLVGIMLIGIGFALASGLA
jgi:uncharacterized membrane protein YfcA